MTAPAYLPQVTCASCNKLLKYGTDVRRYVGRGGKRLLEAKCHGHTQIIPFAAEPNQSVELWPRSSAA